MKLARLITLTITIVLFSVIPGFGQGRGNGMHGQGNIHRSNRGLDRESARARVRQNPRSVQARTSAHGNRGLKLGHFKHHRRERIIVRRNRRHHRRF